MIFFSKKGNFFLVKIVPLKITFEWGSFSGPLSGAGKQEFD